jgi:hypothetical protein
MAAMLWFYIKIFEIHIFQAHITLVSHLRSTLSHHINIIDDGKLLITKVVPVLLGRENAWLF